MCQVIEAWETKTKVRPPTALSYGYWHDTILIIRANGSRLVISISRVFLLQYENRFVALGKPASEFRGEEDPAAPSQVQINQIHGSSL